MTNLAGLELPPVPIPLLNVINGVTSNGDSNGNGFKPPFDTAAALKGAPAGERHRTMLGLAGKLRQADVPLDFAERLILEAAHNCEQPPGNPFTDNDALKQLRDVYKRYPAGAGVIVISEAEAPEEVPIVRHLTVEPNENRQLTVMCQTEDNLTDTNTAFPEIAWTGLFLEWRNTVAKCTEAPLAALWSAFLLAIGMVLGRNVWRCSPRALYLNFYILLLGQTGDSRKSTVLWLACELLRYVGVDFEDLDGVASAEGIYEALSKKESTRGLVAADEFRALLSVAQRKGTQNITPKLNSLYYCPDRSAINRVDPTVIVNPFVSLLAATPQEYIEDILSDLDISGGFLNRFLIISGPEQEDKPLVKPPAPADWMVMADKVRPFGSRVIGHLEMTSSAEKMWIDFYHRWKKERRGYPLKQAKLTARTFEHILKIAVVYSVLAEEHEISDKSMEIAVEVGWWLQSNTLKMFSDIGLDQVGKCEQAIIDRLKRATNSRMWRRDLQREISGRNINGEIFNRAIKTLEINDHITCRQVIVGSGKARPLVEYIVRHKTDNAAKNKGSSV